MNQDQEKIYEAQRKFEQKRLIEAKEMGKGYYINPYGCVIFSDTLAKEIDENTTTNK